MLSPRLQQMVSDRVGLARAIAHREWSKLVGYDRDEITSWAFQGLIAAADRWPAYCAEHGYEPYEGAAQGWFDTYASRRIRGSIIDQLRAGDFATRRERRALKMILAAGFDLAADVCVPTVAAATGLTGSEVTRALVAQQRSPHLIGEPAALEYTWPADPGEVESSLTESTLRSTFADTVTALRPTHRAVFCLAIYQGLSDAEIAARLLMLHRDPLLAPHAVAWVACLREGAVASVVLALRHAVSHVDLVPDPDRARRPAPRPRRAAAEPPGAVNFADLVAC